MTPIPKPAALTLEWFESKSIQDFYDPFEVRKDIEPSPDINASLSVVSQQIYYYGDKFAEAEKQHAYWSEIANTLAAYLDGVVRRQLATSGEKATEKLVSNTVAIESRTLECNRLVREAKAQVVFLKATVDSFKAKKESLIALSYNMREQMKGDPTVREGMGRKSLDHSRFSDSDFEPG